jgi:hypothetical protein
VTDGKMNPKDVAKMKNVSLGTVFLLKNSTSFDDKPRTEEGQRNIKTKILFIILKNIHIFFLINVVISERKIETVKHLQSAPLKNGIMNTE